MNKVPGPQIEIGGECSTFADPGGITVIPTNSSMDKQTRYFSACCRNRPSSCRPALASVSLTGLRVTGRFVTVVKPVSAATTAVQLWSAGSVWLVDCVGGMGGVTDGGIESARAVRR